MQIIDGKLISEQIKAEIAAEVEKIKKKVVKHLIWLLSLLKRWRQRNVCIFESKGLRAGWL
jgi:5,10-methylene-tetrahydrofolate dehydrogenase/methenyl tetrahydrofolate cyclohydrolase